MHHKGAGWIGLTLAAWVVAARSATTVTPPAAFDETRALWVLRRSLTTPASVDAVVAAARAAGFNALLAQVRGRGDAYYRSRTEPPGEELVGQSPDFDPLAALLTAAHRAGLRVHAWLNVGLVASATTLPASPDHVAYRHPEWLMVPRPLAREMAAVDPASPAYLGRLARWTRSQVGQVEGLYLSPIDPEVHAHLSAVVGELAARYAVDGVHFDYIRYPDDRFDYSPRALAAFRAALRQEVGATEREQLDRLADPLAIADFSPEAWARFRRARLSGLVMRLRTAVHAARSGVVVSAAVAPDAEEAFVRRLQDWRAWLENGFVDVVCPMAYTEDPATFTRQIAAARALAGPRAVWAGIGAHRLPSMQVVAFIELARAQRADGVAIFSYDSLTGSDRADPGLAEIGRAFVPPPGSGSR